MYKEYTGTYTHRHAGICTRAYLYSKDVSAPRRCQAQNPVKHLKPETLNPSPALYRQLCQEHSSDAGELAEAPLRKPTLPRRYPGL